MTLLERLLVDSVLASLAYLAVMAATAVTSAFRHGGRRDESVDDPKTLSVSRLAAPVSLLVPVGEPNTAAATAAALTALLDLDYPEFEVIVLAEDLPAVIWDVLKEAWALEAKEFFFRQTLVTEPVRKIYRSSRDPRLMVVDKAPAGRADTLNCGINLARFKYVCAVDAGIAVDADALLRAMSAPLLDPAAVVATTNLVETRGHDASTPGLQGTLQRLQSTRSLMESRLAWRALDAGFGPYDSVVVWRRDAVVQAGGFSEAAPDPDLDLMVRLQTSTTRQNTGRVVRSAEIFGRIDPRPRAAIARLTALRQRSTLHALRCFGQLSGPGKRALTYFVVSEMLTPFVQAWVVAATAIGAAAGWLPWIDMALAVMLLSLGNATVSAASLLVRGSARDAPDERTLRRLLLAAPLDFILSGTAAACARGRGALAFVNDLHRGSGPGR